MAASDEMDVLQEPAVELQTPVPGQEADILTPQEDEVFTGEEIEVAGKLPKLSTLLGDKDLGKLKERVGAATSEDTEHLLQHNAGGRLIDPARTDTRNFGLASIHTTDDIKQLIDGTSTLAVEGASQRYRRPLTHAEAKARASDPMRTDLSVKDILGRKPSSIWNAEQLTRARMIMVQAAGELMDDAERINNTAKPSADELWVFRKKIANYVALQRQVQGAVKEAGRVLNAMQIPVGTNELATLDLEEIVENLGGREMTQRMAKMFVRSGGDPAQIAKIARRSWHVRGWNALMEVWINGLLSAPSTHFMNMGGNTMNVGLGSLERYGAAIVRKIRSIFGANAKDGVTFAEANAVGSALLEAPGFMWRAGADALKHQEGDTTKMLDPTHIKGGQLPRQPAFAAAQLGLNEEGVLGKGVDFFGKWYVRLPGRFLQAEDEMFKAAGYVMELKALAVRQAIQEGHEPGSETFVNRVSRLMTEPTQEVHVGAMNFSRYQTFTNDLTNPGYSGKQVAAKGSQLALQLSKTPYGRLFLPFVRTPVNIMKYGLARSPFGVAMPSVWNDIKAGGAARDLAIARLSLGSMTAAAAYGLTRNMGEDEAGNPVHRPLITGAGPRNYIQRKAWESAGIKPYSIYIDGVYLSYNRFDPFGQMLGSMATTMELMANSHGEAEKAEIAQALVVGISEYYLDRSFFTGLSQLQDLLNFRTATNESAINKVKRWTTTFGASFVPNWMARTAKDIDPVRRDPRSSGWLDEYLNRVQVRTPWWSETAAPAIDMLGDEILHAEPLMLLHAISPFEYSVARSHPDIAMHLIENQVADKTPRTSTVRVSDVNGEDLKYDMLVIDPDGHMFADYKKVLGKRRKVGLERLFATQVYKDAPVGVIRADMIGAVLTKARQDVVAEMFKVEGVGKRRAKADVLAVLHKYRDELRKHRNDLRKANTSRVRTGVTLPPHYTYPMTE